MFQYFEWPAVVMATLTRKLVQFILRAVDLNKLTSKVQVLEAENNQLRTRTKQLENEVINIYIRRLNKVLM